MPQPEGLLAIPHQGAASLALVQLAKLLKLLASLVKGREKGRGAGGGGEG